MTDRRRSAEAGGVRRGRRLADQLIDASHQIHAHPELNFEERVRPRPAHRPARRAGLAPDAPRVRRRHRVRGACRRRGPDVAVLCEYDALPGDRPRVRPQRHRHRRSRRRPRGGVRGRARPAARVRIMGTPAEEGGGGKIEMARKGAFDGRRRGDDGAPRRRRPDRDGLHRHPGAARAVPRQGGARRGCTVGGPQRARRRGARLHEHRRAAPAHPAHRAHPRHLHQGGDKANIVPSETAMDWSCGRATIESLQPLKQRVLTCLESAATACGCTMTTSGTATPTPT